MGGNLKTSRYKQGTLGGALLVCIVLISSQRHNMAGECDVLPSSPYLVTSEYDTPIHKHEGLFTRPTFIQWKIFENTAYISQYALAQPSSQIMKGLMNNSYARGRKQYLHSNK